MLYDGVTESRQSLTKVALEYSRRELGPFPRRRDLEVTGRRYRLEEGHRVPKGLGSDTRRHLG